MRERAPAIVFCQDVRKDESTGSFSLITLFNEGACDPMPGSIDPLWAYVVFENDGAGGVLGVWIETPWERLEAGRFDFADSPAPRCIGAPARLPRIDVHSECEASICVLWNDTEIARRRMPIRSP